MDKIKILLYKSLDGELTAVERVELNAALQADPALQKELKEIKTMRGNFNGLQSETFSDDFTAAVMDRVFQVRNEKIGSSIFNDLLAIFKPLALTSILVIVLLSSINFLDIGKLSIPGIFASPEISFDEIMTADNEIFVEYK